MKHRRLSFVSLLLAAILLLAACGNDQTPATSPEIGTPSAGTPAASASPEATEPMDAVGNMVTSVTPAVLTPPVDVTPTPGADGTPDVTPDASVPTGTGTADPTEGSTLQPTSPVPTSAGNPTPTGNKTPTSTPKPIQVSPTSTPPPTKGAVKDTPTPKPSKAPAKNTPTPQPTKAPAKKPGNTSTPSPTPTPDLWDWFDPWDDAVCRDDIAAALLANVNAYRVSKEVPAYENPYDYEDIEPGLGDYLTEKAHRVAKANALLGSKSQSKHEGGQIGTGLAYWRSSTDAEVVQEIAEELFITWYNSKPHNRNMLSDHRYWSDWGLDAVDVSVMAVYEYYDGIFFYYAAIMGSGVVCR